MKREELVKALEAVIPGVEKTPLTGMDSVIFENEWLQTFNDSISISYPLKSGISCYVRAEELLKIASKMEGEEIDAEVSSEEVKQRVTFRNNQTVLKMTYLDGAVIKEKVDSLELSRLKWSNIPEGFIYGVELCLISSTSKEAMGMLTGIYFSEKEIFATDNLRVSRYVLKENLPEDFILPTSSVANLLQLRKESDSPVEISLGEGWVHFRTKKGVIFSIRKMYGDYPIKKVSNLFQTLEQGQVFTFPSELEKALVRAEVLSIEEGTPGFANYVTLRKIKDKLVLKGKRDIGEIIEKILWKDSAIPEKMEISISPVFLRKILPVSKSFFLSKDGRFLVFNAPNFQHIIMSKIIEE